MKKHSPALVSKPEGLGLLLELVNLLPVQFRHPYWAVRKKDNRRKSSFAMYEKDILTWQFDEASMAARLALYLDRQIDDELITNTPDLLWIYLQASLREMPLALQAFVLRDEQGNEVELDGEIMPRGVDSDLQAWRNLSIIRKSERELKKIVQEASKRLDRSIKDQASGKRPPQIPDFDHPESLLERVRQRLILVLGIQELLSNLMHPERRNDLFFAGIYYQSDASQSHFYTDKEGKVRFTPSMLVKLLEGVEAARLRECPICFKFFWAGRKDMRSCSTRCANTLRMREYRQRYFKKSLAKGKK